MRSKSVQHVGHIIRGKMNESGIKRQGVEGTKNPMKISWFKRTLIRNVKRRLRKGTMSEYDMGKSLEIIQELGVWDTILSRIIYADVHTNIEIKLHEAVAMNILEGCKRLVDQFLQDQAEQYKHNINMGGVIEVKAIAPNIVHMQSADFGPDIAKLISKRIEEKHKPVAWSQRYD